MAIVLGCDLGSSSIKVSIFDTVAGKNLSTAHSPNDELPISTPEVGFAEQDPDMWWTHFKLALISACHRAKIQAKQIEAIGISYQMHGLIMLDKNGAVLRPAIIWCDGRAVEIGRNALEKLGESYCFNNLLNAPGNFTATKLAWVKQNEPEVFERCAKFLLPGDFLAFKLSGEIATTESGLSEAILWNFSEHGLDSQVLEALNLNAAIVPKTVDTFGAQAHINEIAAKETGLQAGIPITYRAGDQPNNAFSLGVINPGQIAATAGTSGVLYTVSENNFVDPSQTVNTFLHVNNSVSSPRRGVLLCINGTGCAYSWLRRAFGAGLNYEDLNKAAQKSEIGSEGILFFPYGNGAERTLANRAPGAAFMNLDFNRSQLPDLARAVQEGIAFAMYYATEAVREGRAISAIHAGKANLFLSPVFRSCLANLMNAPIQLCDTDGSQGAARGAAYGAGFYTSLEDTFASLTCLERHLPNEQEAAKLRLAYQNWRENLEKILLTTN
jgi:xylulokinase